MDQRDFENIKQWISHLEINKTYQLNAEKDDKCYVRYFVVVTF